MTGSTRQDTGYATVTVVIGGALESEEEFFDHALLNARIDEIRRDAASNGYQTEVYVLEHEHEPISCPSCASDRHEPTPGGYRCHACGYTGRADQFTECECAQYVQDYRPAYAWNVDADAEVQSA